MGKHAGVVTALLPHLPALMAKAEPKGELDEGGTLV